MADCSAPVVLPSRPLTQQEVERFWGTDKAHQIECAKRHAILRDYIIERDGLLAGRKK